MLSFTVICKARTYATPSVFLKKQPEFKSISNLIMSSNEPRVCILLSTYNGEKYLAEQLKSIERQRYKNWFVIISDDGSNDRTIDIARNYQQKWGESRLIILQGPQQGFCANFLSMASNPAISADLYAFCDQDDIWLPEKFDYIVRKLEWSQLQQMPTVYCGRTEIVDESLQTLGKSPNFKRQPSFENALVQSIAGGNTMVFNQCTKELLESTGITDVASHDWWLYQLITGVGGTVYYDPKPLIKYRQHSNSLIGANISYFSQIKRIVHGFNNGFKSWNTINLNALAQVRKHLTAENKATLEMFEKIRNTKNPFKRLTILRAAGLYRQSKSDTVKLWVACFLNKI